MSNPNKRLQLRRNSDICQNQEEAQERIEAIAQSGDFADGEPVLARYYTDEYQDNVNVLMGVQTKNEDDEAFNIAYVALDNGQILREVRDVMTSGTFFLDFSDVSNTIQMANMSDKTMRLSKINLHNVGKLMLTTSSMVKREVTEDNVNTFEIATGDIMTWDIQRTVDNQIASVGVNYKLI